MDQCAYPDCEVTNSLYRIKAYDPIRKWCEKHRACIRHHGYPDSLKTEYPFAILREEVEFLAHQEYTRKQIAERLGVKWGSISRAYSRNQTPVPPIPLAPHPGSRR